MRMKSLEEVFEAIEAFKEAMEKLGVRVHATVESTPVGVGHEVEILLKTRVRVDIEVDYQVKETREA